MKRRTFVRWSTASALVSLAGCGTLAQQLSPKDAPPKAPNAYRRGDPALLPSSAPSLKSAWWKRYGDKRLNALVEAMHKDQPDLKAAYARLEQSHAVLGQTRAGLWPTVRGEASSKRRRDSINELLFPIDEPEYDRYRLGTTVSWEMDLWGRVRGMAQRDRLLAAQQGELYQDTKLSLEANLARQYFAWRSACHEQHLLEEAIRVREDDLALQEARLELGSGVQVDVARSEVALREGQAAAESARRSIGKLEHALAILTGQAPSEFQALAKPRHRLEAPDIPSGIPSDLLRRRPDLRAAESAWRAAATQVGVRATDFLPRITLTGSGGVASLKTSNLFASDSVFFDVGPEVSVPLFQAGTRRAAMREAKAAFQEQTARYRSALLTAVQEVEDALLDAQSLAREWQIQREAVKAAEGAASLARLRHERGLSSYFEVVEAEQDRLQAERAENALHGERFTTSVTLVQALGGAVGS